MSDIGNENIFDIMLADINSTLDHPMEGTPSQVDLSLDTMDLSENTPANVPGSTGVSGHTTGSESINNAGSADIDGPSDDDGVMDIVGSDGVLGSTDAHAIAGTVSPSACILDNNSNPPLADQEPFKHKMWMRIMRDDPHGVNVLLREGADPMLHLKFSGYAIDMAVRMGRKQIVTIFHRTSKDLADFGIRTLLTAVAEDQKEIVRIILNLGMRRKLIDDENLKLIFYGFTCRHGTPEMLEFLETHGTWFSWKAYWRWCLSLTKKIDARENGFKILELRAKYMEREKQKRPHERSFEEIDFLTEGQELKPLEEFVHVYCETYPNVVIQDYFVDGYTSPSNKKQLPDVFNFEEWPELYDNVHDRLK